MLLPALRRQRAVGLRCGQARPRPHISRCWRSRLRSATGSVVATVALVSACSGPATRPLATPGVIEAVGAESQYADVVSQIGGVFVRSVSLLENPNTDPHSFESSPAIAREVSRAQVVVENGAGYDDFMRKLDKGISGPHHTVIVAQQVMALPTSVANPHLWYDPNTMLAVAKRITLALSAAQPSHATYFSDRLAVFELSVRRLLDQISEFKTRFGGTAVATTEPVADYLLAGLGLRNVTPFRFQADIMNGVDPAPEDISDALNSLSAREVKAFCYNVQVSDALTSSLKRKAVEAGVPAVAVYETMPQPGYDYQSWMAAEVTAIATAIAFERSTTSL